MLFENAVVILIFVVGRGLLSVYDSAFPLSEAEPVKLRHLIKRAPECPFSLNVKMKWGQQNDEILIDGGAGTWMFWREKLNSLISDTRTDDIGAWVIDQIGMRHLFADVFFQENIWLAIFSVAMIGVLVHVFVFDPLVSDREKAGKLPADFRKKEATAAEMRFRKYIAEKLLILAFVIVRAPDAYGFSESVAAGALKWSHRVSDATVFAVWYILVWSVQTTTITANYRFEVLTSSMPEGERATVPIRLHSILFSSFCVSAAMMSLSMTAFQVIHPLYAAIFLSESLCLLIRSTYVAFRIVQYHFGKDDEVSQRKLYFLKRFSDMAIDSIFAAQYGILLCVGVLLNGRIFPFVFVPRATAHVRKVVHHCMDHYRGQDLSRFID